LRWPFAFPLATGLATSVLGLAVLAAAYAGRLSFGPLRVPAGSALGLVVAGAALTLHAIGRHRQATALALGLAAGAALALAHHALIGVATGGDVALSPWPAASTAFCLLMVGVAVTLARRSPGATWSLGIGVVALAVLGATGRVLELHSTFVGMMPLPAAVGLMMLGLGLALASWPRASITHTDAAGRYTPYAAGFTALLATVLFWQSLVAHQRAEIRRMVEMTAIGSLAELGGFVASVSRALEHLADEWNGAGRLPAAQWRYQSRLILERLGGPRAVEWIDTDFDVVYVVVPPRTGQAARQSAPAAEPAPPVDDAGRRAMANALASRRAIVTPTFPYERDKRGWRLAVPLFRANEADGFVSAFFVTDEMFDELLAVRSHDYLITVFDGDRQIYGPRLSAAAQRCPWCRPYTLDLPGGHSWEIWVRPSAELLATIETSFPKMILASGILISLLLTAMLKLLERERRAARDLARTNRALHDEVGSRRTAEQEIRTLATELEQRVRDRTGELAASNTALRTENALRQRAQATLEASNGNLRHFASFVSHELRQPLATMALWAELLETNPDVDLNERGRGYLKQLRAAIDRMTGFLEAQLRLARATYTQPSFDEDVDVAALLRELVADGTLGLRQVGATVEIADLPTIRADSAQLRQLFRNLLENALKYRRPNVPLAIRIDGGIAHRDHGRHCEIRVADNGQGFAESDAEKIFDLFEQLPGRKVVGSGVGLAICRRIVEHHGGTIRAEGRPGAGATFLIDLPLERCEGRDGDGVREVVRP
jgi:signal transduction histidine kinase